MLGLLGGGQLGRMFAAEAVRMGYRVMVVDPGEDPPAAIHATEHLRLPWDDPEALRRVAAECSAVTTEFENVPAAALEALATSIPVRPAASAVAICQDRRVEKEFLNRADVATVRWCAVDDTTDIDAAWQAVGGQAAVLKTARLGYDGKGQWRVHSREELAEAVQELDGRSAILEKLVALAREVSVMVARGSDGKVCTWPVGENVHRNGILHTTVVPAEISPVLATHAAYTAIRISEQLEYVGVLGVEFFVTGGGELFVNELAPRPHNSGHWTLDASVTSQFEQQVRTLTDLPLGDTALLRPIAMINLLGDLWDGGAPHWARALEIPGVRLHLYGKKKPRKGRKMGHLVAIADSAELALANATEAWERLGGAGAMK